MKKTNWLLGITLFLVGLIACEKAATDKGGKDFANDLKNTDMVALELAFATANYEVIDTEEVPAEFCGLNEYELLGGKTLDAGSVIIANDDTYLYVTIHAKDGFQNVSENVKIWLGSSMPFTKRPVSGKFPYKFTVTEGLDFTVKFLLTDLGVTDVCKAGVIFAVIHVDAVVDVADITTEETAYAGVPGTIQGPNAWWYYVSYTPGCCDDDPVTPPTCEDETAWGGDTGLNVDDKGAWWYYFDAAGPLTQKIWAGQHKDAGTVTYDPAAGTLTISLNSYVSLQNDDEAVKIAGFTTIPTKRPAGGHFTYKGRDLVVTVGEFPFYAIHLDVVVCPAL